MIKGAGKRGQITIFVIVAVAIAIVVLAVFLFPQINVFADDVEPNSFLRNCIESDAREMMEQLALQGGYAEPGNSIMYQGQDIEYLCYTSDNYSPCVVQQPLIKKHFEDEIMRMIEPRAQGCLNELVSTYESRGYDVSSTPGELSVSFVPGNLVLDFIAPLSVTKESTQTFSKVSTSIETEMYGLLLTATSIVEYESTLGNTETLLYIQYYPNLIIEKIERDGGTTIYRLTNVVSGDEFRFASRSLVWPPGYNLEGL